jgi:beta-lactamase class A
LYIDFHSDLLNDIYHMKNKGYMILGFLLLIGLAITIPRGIWLSNTKEFWISDIEKAIYADTDSLTARTGSEWVSRLEDLIARVDKNTAGNIGVYVKIAGDDRTLTYNADKNWYLSSIIKVPLAIAVLQRAEAGDFSLEDKLTLQESDFVDGAGDLLSQSPGTTYTIAELIDKMLRNSDSSATDMLMRLIGEEAFNEQIRQEMVPEGFNPITTILQVRYDAYSELHENVLNLTNKDILYVHSTRSRPERLRRLVERMAINRNELKASSIEEAFERYYKRGLNSAKLESMGILLERLYNGELLSEEHTDFLLSSMEAITTGDRRIKAGLPKGTRFAQKTGTQIESAGNVGIIFPNGNQGKKPVIVAVYVENFGNINEAEKAFELVGRLLAESFL